MPWGRFSSLAAKAYVAVSSGFVTSHGTEERKGSHAEATTVVGAARIARAAKGRSTHPGQEDRYDQ